MADEDKPPSPPSPTPLKDDVGPASGSWYFNTMKTFPKEALKPKEVSPEGELFGRYAPPQYDLSHEEFDKIRRRVEIRRRLKSEYNSVCYDPYKYLNRVELHNPSIERFMAMRVSIYEHWKPTWKGFFTYYGICLVPIFAVGYFFSKRREKLEARCRAGLYPAETRWVKMAGGCLP